MWPKQLRSAHAARHFVGNGDGPPVAKLVATPLQDRQSFFRQGSRAVRFMEMIRIEYKTIRLRHGSLCVLRTSCIRARLHHCHGESPPLSMTADNVSWNSMIPHAWLATTSHARADVGGAVPADREQGGKNQPE